MSNLPDRRPLRSILFVAAGALLLLWLCAELQPSPTRGQDLLYPPERTLERLRMDGGAPFDAGTVPPPYRTRVLEPSTSTRLTRVSGAGTNETPKSGTPAVIRHHSSRRQEWNADGSLLMMGSTYLLDGKTYQRVGIYSEYSHETFWSHSQPNIMYAFRAPTATADGALMRITLTRSSPNSSNNQYTQTAVELRTFPRSQFPEMSAGRGRGRLSEDDRHLALMAKVGTTLRLMVVDLAASGAPIVNTRDFVDMWPASGPRMEGCSVSPSGNYVVVAWEFALTGATQGVDVYTRESPGPTATLIDQRDLAAQTEDGDLCWKYNPSGAKTEETWVQIVSGSYEGTLGADLAGWELRTGNMFRPIPRPATPAVDFPGTVSCANYKRPGWAYVTAATDSSMSADAVTQVFAIKVQDNPQNSAIPVQTFAQHKSNSYTPYYEIAQPQATPDPFGLRLMFASNWNGYSTTSDIFSYVSERPNPIQLLPNAQSPTRVVVSSATQNSVSCASSGRT